MKSRRGDAGGQGPPGALAAGGETATPGPAGTISARPAAAPDTMQPSAGAPGRIVTRQFVAVWIASFAGYLSFYLIQQPTLPLYVEHLGGSARDIGWVGGAFSITTLLSRPLVGRAVDSIGRRLVLLAAAVVFLVCAPLYALASVIPALIGLRMLHGTGMAMFTTSATTYATDLAPAGRRAELVSYFGIANNLALGLGPLAAALIIGAGVGFDRVFLVAAAVALLMLAAVLPAGESPHPTVRRRGWSFDSLISRRALAPAALMLTVAYTYGALATFLAVSTVQAGLGTGVSAWYWATYAATLIVVRLFSGRLADRYGRATVIVPGLLMVAAAMALAAVLDSLPLAILSSMLYAAGFGFVYPALLALTVDRVEATTRGVAMATFSVSFDVGIGIGAMLSGLLAASLGYPLMYALSGAAPLAGLAGYLLMIRRNHVRQAGGPQQ